MVSYYVCQQSYVSTTKLDYVKLQLLMMENLQKLKKMNQVLFKLLFWTPNLNFAEIFLKETYYNLSTDS